MLKKTVQQVCKELQEEYNKWKNKKRLTKNEYDTWNINLVNKLLKEIKEEDDKENYKNNRFNKIRELAVRCKY